MSQAYDLIVIGAGHNGLVTAAYLARAGSRVLVLERRDLLGGACVTEEVWPGFKVSVAAYVNSLLRREIIRDLKLADHGFQMLPRNPSSFTPFPDGRYLLMGPDRELNHREVSKFSPRDAENLPRYEAMLDRMAELLEPLMMEPPPDPFSGKLIDLWRTLRLAWRFRRAGSDGAQMVEILSGAARPILDRWFESEAVKITLATDSVIGLFGTPSMPGSAYNLFHHLMGEVEGVRGAWGYVRGGMGTIAQALAAAARRHGAEIRTNAEVARILVRDGRAAGVVLADGSELLARRVASNATPHVTFLKLLDAKELPPEFVEAVRRVDYSSASLKINVALSEVPDFTCLPGNQPGSQHRGTIHLCPSFDYLERAYDDAKYGRPSQSPMIEMGLPSVVDPSVAPPGQHLMSMFVQYAPYHLREGIWDDVKEAFADRVFEIVNEYAPNFRRSVINRMVLSPVDIERRFGLTGGNIFQGVMVPPQLFSLRPTAGCGQYRTPIRGLYLCGSATHPGGGVMGASGYNAAREILRDRWR